MVVQISDHLLHQLLWDST